MNPWRGLKNLPREMWILSAATLVNRSGTMVLAFLVLYVTHTLGVTPARAALTLMVYGLAALLIMPLAGVFVRSRGTAADHEGFVVSHGFSAAAIPIGEKLRRDFDDDVGVPVLNESLRPASAFDGFGFGAARATQSSVCARRLAEIWG